jgi:hypothetical protein
MIAVRVTPGAVYLGRPVLVAVSLSDLRGPGSGTMQLPLHLFWSATDGRFSLDDPAERREVYQIVLSEARRPGDLAAFLHGGTLTGLWPGLFLPRLVRRAWEDQHPALRDPAPAARLAGQPPQPNGGISRPCPSRAPA